MSKSEDFQVRLNFALRESQESGLGSSSILYDVLRRVGIRIPPHHYCPFFVNLLVVTSWWYLMVGIFLAIFVRIKIADASIGDSMAIVLGTPQLMIGAIVVGFVAAAGFKFLFHKYKLTPWKQINVA